MSFAHAFFWLAAPAIARAPSAPIVACGSIAPSSSVATVAPTVSIATTATIGATASTATTAPSAQAPSGATLDREEERQAGIPSAGGAGAAPEIVRAALAPEIESAWLAARVGRPVLRGFRAPLPLATLAPAHEFLGLARESGAPRLAIDPPELAGDAARARALAIVVARLARDGLPATLAAAIEALGPATFGREDDLARLAEVGLPVDWIACFSPPDGDRGVALHAWIARALAAGKSLGDLRPDLARCPFAFAPTRAGFRVATESGETPIAALRLQVTNSSDYAGPGDGGAVDVVRQLARLLPDADLVTSVGEKHLAGFVETARGWSAGRTGRFVLLPSPLAVSQWAQDDGKPGIAAGAGGAGEREIVLVPRYATRGEDGASFIPGESLALAGVAAAGVAVVQSPLLVQGGNLLAVRDPRDGARILFVGEAEVERNAGLGLTREQALEALRIELGVDRCVVLPAVSFHVDFDVTIRAIEGGLVAFVNDPGVAHAIVVGCGIDVLESQGILAAEPARQARDHLRHGRANELLTLLGPMLGAQAVGIGQFPEKLALPFARGPSDSGVGNLQRFLLALDEMSSGVPGLDSWALDPHTGAYMRSFLRRAEARVELERRLVGLGIRVVRVPSSSDEERGINYLNGIHAPGRYLMPAYGGLFEALDRVAARAFAEALGPSVEIVPVLCGETQRRGGGIHCAVSTLARPLAR